MGQLKKRFTLVELTTIQSQCFHDDHQTAKETVDEFAQELKNLFHKASSNLARGGVEAEATGQSVLANQFVSDLQPELKKVLSSYLLRPILRKQNYEICPNPGMDNEEVIRHNNKGCRIIPELMPQEID